MRFNYFPPCSYRTQENVGIETIKRSCKYFTAELFRLTFSGITTAVYYDLISLSSLIYDRASSYRTGDFRKVIKTNWAKNSRRINLFDSDHFDSIYV